MLNFLIIYHANNLMNIEMKDTINGFTNIGLNLWF